MKERIVSFKELLFSKAYILITSKVMVFRMDLQGYDGFMKLHTMKMLQTNLDEAVKQAETQYAGDEKPPKPKKKGK